MPGRRTARSIAAAVAIAAVAAIPASAGASDELEQRVVGGSTTSIEDYPWQAAVDFTGSGNGFQRQFCGGSLVTSRIVVTAAHCVKGTDPDCSTAGQCANNDPGGDGTIRIDPNDVSVILGRTVLSGTAGTEHGVIDVAYQPDFNQNTLENDVGYLVLATPSVETPIEIAGPSEAAVWEPDRLTEVTGWGATAESGAGSGGSDTLRVATVPIVADSTCALGSVYGSEFKPASMVCAGYLSGGFDTCYGDSGGPLEAPLQDGGYRLVGITSWGYGCAQANAPGVYTRVAGTALRDPVAAKLAALEDANGIAHENVIGSGGEPPTSAPPPPDPDPQPDTGTAPATTSAADTTSTVNPFKKCRKIKSATKRKRCNRKVKRSLD